MTMWYATVSTPNRRLVRGELARGPSDFPYNESDRGPEITLPLAPLVQPNGRDTREGAAWLEAIFRMAEDSTQGEQQ